MFRSKKDIDRHVTDVLSKIHNENERNLRGYNFARLYYQVKDYDTARKHLSCFLSVRDHHAPSHKLMAQIFEATGNVEKALHCYKRALEVDQNQKDIILKICELYCQLPVDHETARYWADRADQLFPHSNIVFRLRECLVTAEGDPNRQELEMLISNELEAQPKNLSLRIKLLRLYLDTERVKEAYDHALKVERKKPFAINTDWYYMLLDIFEAYQEEFASELDSDFYILFLTTLDHLIFLTLAEPHSFGDSKEIKSHASGINDAASVLLTFDQHLKKACEKDLKSGAWTYFLQHMKGQLYYHMATLLMKRAKKDQGNWKEACRIGAALFLVGYTFKPANLLHEVWFSQMEDQQKIFTNFFQRGALRTSFIGHVIMALCKEEKSQWLQKIKQDVCLPQVRDRAYNRLFSNMNQKQNSANSHFLNDPAFVESSLEFPSHSALEEYDKYAYKLCPNSLHHLVWLHLHQENRNNESSQSSLYEAFKGLQYSNNSLSKGSPESLCQLDVEAYLQATLYTTSMLLDQRSTVLNTRNEESPLCVPPDIAVPLCTKEQGLWWCAAHGLVNNIIKDRLGEQRRILQRGLEVIRGIGNHGLEVQLVVHLARTFADKAVTLSTDLNGTQFESSIVGRISSDKSPNLEFRAVHYWSVALGMLDKLSANQTIKVPKDRMFVGFNKGLSKEEVFTLREEGQLYLACRLMNSGKLEEAAGILEKLSSPFASFYLALTYKKSALQESKSSTTRSALLNKAKDALYATMDRLNGDNSHTLNQDIYVEVEEIEAEIAKEMNCDNDTHNSEDSEVDVYDDNNSSFQNASRNGTPSHAARRILMYSTPRPSASFMSAKSKHRENTKSTPHLEPSPERLDAQIRALAMTQTTLVKTLMEQQRTLLDTNRAIVEELKKNKEVVEQLKKQLEDMHISTLKGQHRTLNRKPGMSKGQGDDEEKDYNEYDANGYLEYYVDENAEDYRNSGYGYDHSSHMAPDGTSSTMNYAPQVQVPSGPPPTLTPYGYQYPPPPHPSLPPPPGAIPERYYHTGHPGLPFSEGQQLPQFRFHVASPMMKPPVLNSVSAIPQTIPNPALPPPTMSSHLPPPVITPPWVKTGTVPHAFQIPLPPSAQPISSSSQPPAAPTAPPSFASATSFLSTTSPSASFVSAAGSESQLKSLLNNSTTLTFGNNTGSPVTSATIPPRSGEVSMFANKTPETLHVNRSRNDSDVCSDNDIEREVMGDFKPVIPLPAEVIVETGEEEEIVIFEDRAKLFRFVDKEWKERGIGTVKLLSHEPSGRVRLLMRRDQVLKVCANHCILPTMEIQPMKGSDRAWTWVAHDFADETVRLEQFCIRFKTIDVAVNFKEVFENSIEIAKQIKNTSLSASLNTSDSHSSMNGNVSVSSKHSFGSKFLPKAGSWTCPTCYVSNAADKELCVACETEKPGLSSMNKSPFTVSSSLPIANITSTVGLCNFDRNSLFQSPVISLNETLSASPSDTKNKNIYNQQTSSNFATQFATNQSINSGTKTDKSKAVFGNFGFTSTAVTIEKESKTGKDLQPRALDLKVTPPVSKTVLPKATFDGFTFRSPAVGKNETDQGDSKTGQVTSSSDKPTATFGGFTFSSTPVVAEKSTPEEADREILVVSMKAKGGPQVTKVETSKSSPFSGFSFRSPSAPSSFSSTPTLITKQANSSVTTVQTDKKAVNTINKEPVFGSNSDVTKFQFTSLSKSDVGFQKDPTFQGFSGTNAPLFVTVTKEGRRVSGEHVGEVAPEDFEPNIDFKPVVPLPALVDTKTGEEDQEKLFGERAKLFRYDNEGKQWKERGIGELKILYFKTAEKYRILMRREQVLKICANHYILPEMKLTTLQSSDRSWVWMAQDFSEGDLRHEQFAAKFKNADIAKLFFSVFERCTAELKEIDKRNEARQSHNASLEENETDSQTLSLSEKLNNPCIGNKTLFSELFRPVPGSWECQTCFVRNEENSDQCASCTTLKPVNKNVEAKPAQFVPDSTTFSDNFTKPRTDAPKPAGNGNSAQSVSGSNKLFAGFFKQEPGTWECSTCYVRNDKKKNNCVACETAKPVSSAPDNSAQPTADNKLFDGLFKPEPGSWECNSCYIRNDKNKTSCVACETIKPGSSAPDNSAQTVVDNKLFAGLFKPEPGSWECSSCYIRNDKSKNSCAACETAKPGSSISQPATQSIFGKLPFGTAGTSDGSNATSGSFLFGNKEAAKSSSTGFVFGARASQSSPTFRFGMSSILSNSPKESFGFKPNLSNASPSSAGAIFGGKTISPKSSPSTTDAVNASEPTSAANIPPAKTGNQSVFGNSTNFPFGASSPKKEDEDPDSVEFRFGSPQKYDFNFSGVRPRSPPKWPKSPRSPGTPTDVEEEDEVEPSDVDNIYFQPVIPLPPKVDVKTGEEGETVLLNLRAKLFRFVDGEWKERGVGDIKILRSSCQKIRLLMRRDQVLKVCLNHYVTKDIEFTWKGDKTLLWATADFSENEPSPEKFAIRFKTPELATQFKEALDSALNNVCSEETQSLSSASTITSQTVSSSSITYPDFSFKLDQKKSETPTGFSLKMKFDAATPPQSVFGNKPIISPAIRSLDFSVKNGVSALQPSSDANTESDKNTSTTSQPSSFWLSQDGDKSKSAMSSPFSLSSRFGASNSARTSVFGNTSVLSTSPAAAATTITSVEKPDPDVEIVYQATPTAEQIAAAAKLMLPTTFYLYQNKPPCKGCRGCIDEIPTQIGEKEIVVSSTKEEIVVDEDKVPSAPETEAPSEPLGLFSNSTLSTFSFADLASKQSGFDALSSTSPTKLLFPGAGTPLFGSMNHSHDNEDEDGVVQAPDLHFEPVIPLPELVDVKTGEEDETPIFCNRAKLYRFDTSSGQWKERGVGEFKILKHNQKCRYRLLLRREQVHKVACNHCISEKLELKPMNTSDSSLCWSAVDYSEGRPEDSQFAVRFKNKELLQEFRDKFNECKVILAAQSVQASPVSGNAIKDVLAKVEQQQAAIDTVSSSSSDKSTPVHLISGSPKVIQAESVPVIEAPARSYQYETAEVCGAATSGDSDEEEDDDDEEEEDIMYEKRVTFEIFDETAQKFQPAGLGPLQILYDDNVYGYRIVMTSDKGITLCDHIIAIQTCLRIEKRTAVWAAIDISIEPPRRRQFRANFSSSEALSEFNKVFEEGKQAAVHAEIVEKSNPIPNFNKPTDPNLDRISKGNQI